jgi:hypothetical protein
VGTTHKFEVIVEDDNNDACKTAFVKRVQSSVYMSVLSVSICTATVHRRIGHQSKSFNLMSRRESKML